MLTPTERQAIMDEVDAGTFDLEDALNDIAIEQRGEGVRRAIYGGILLVNHEGKAGAVDVKARAKMDLLTEDVGKQIDTLEKQMGAFIANNSGTIRSTLKEETVLMNTTVTFTAPEVDSPPTGAIAVKAIPLSDLASNYDYIEIEYAGAGRTQIARFKPDQLRQTVHFSVTKFVDSNSYTTSTVESGGTQQTVYSDPRCELVIVNFRADYDVADNLYVEATVWRWGGTKNSDGFNKSEITASDGVRIFRITGIKYTQVDSTTKDAELTDLRVGYDDTEYESAGEAIRAQIQDLWTAVNAINVAAPAVDENGYLRFDGGD